MKKNNFISKIFIVFISAVFMFTLTGCLSSGGGITERQAQGADYSQPRAALAPPQSSSTPLIPAVITLTDYQNIPGVSTTFTYSVTSGTKPAISHWVISIPVPDGQGVLIYSSEPVVWTESDPTTGTRGVKFDIGYNDGETRVIVITLAGDWLKGQNQISIKSGLIVEYRSVEGPVRGQAPAPLEYDLNGYLFYDINQNGTKDPDEPGLSGQTVLLNDGRQAVTDNNGYYNFVVTPGSYTVTAPYINGINFGGLSVISLVISNSDSSANNFQYVINFNSIIGQPANGFTIGFWKNNIKKAVDGQTKGVQISAAVLQNYISSLSNFALEPLNALTLSEAYSILNANGSDPALLLAKQLEASELNFKNGAYIGGNALLTELFVYYGEYLLKHRAQYGAADLLNAQKLYDAYNNSHGGPIVFVQ